jgi:hypothetical protein
MKKIRVATYMEPNMFKKVSTLSPMERLRYAIELCSTLARAAPNCFHRLYGSDARRIYHWTPKLSRHAVSTMADVTNIIENCHNETCICKKLKKIIERLSRW